MPSHFVHLLLVEDNPGDIRLTEETFRESRFQNTMDVVRDGEEALAYLRREREYSDRRAPDVLLLDMSLPRMDGFELLEEIRSDPSLRELPVVILAASKVDQSIIKRYNVHSDCFIVKPLTVERFVEAVRCFPHLGLTIVKLAGT